MSSSMQQMQDIQDHIHEIQFGIKCLQQVLIDQPQTREYDELLDCDNNELLNCETDELLNGETDELLNGEHNERERAIEAYKMCDELILSCVSISENVQKIKNEFDDETDRLRVLINKMSNKLPFIDRLKYRAEARGIKLSDFDMKNIPEEAGSFYSYDELSCEFLRLLEEEQKQQHVVTTANVV